MKTNVDSSNRGSALVSVLLVVLVLTVVGLGVAYFMQVEDKLSGNEKQSKTSFYAAEAGLKAGEYWINKGFQASGNYLYLGQLVIPRTPSISPPGGGQPAYLLIIPSITGVTVPSFLDVPVIENDSTQGTYTLYVRKQSGADPTSVNLVSVGKGPAGNTRILEEQLVLPNLSTSAQPTGPGGSSGGSGAVGVGSS